MQFVKINDEFEIGKYPVTNAQYRDFCINTNRQYPKLIAEHVQNTPLLPVDDSPFWLHPVVHVSYHDATAFCEHYGYVLPTEKQWYLAAAGKEERKYPWGNNWDIGCCNSRESRIYTTSPIGTFPRGNTPEGVCDMAGNVWEWTSTAHEYGGFVLRGGSWGCYLDLAACAFRGDYLPDYHDFNSGFRCCHIVKPKSRQISLSDIKNVELQSGEVISYQNLQLVTKE